MAIISPKTSPNHVPVDYFRVSRIEISCAPGDPQPKVAALLGYYYNQDARNLTPEVPVFSGPEYFSIDDMVAAGYPDPRALVYDYLLHHHPMFAGTNAASDEPPTETPDAMPMPAVASS